MNIRIGIDTLPDPDQSWDNFMAAVQTSLDTCSTVYCPIGLQAMPWINMAALLNYIPDPVRIVVEKNEVS